MKRTTGWRLRLAAAALAGLTAGLATVRAASEDAGRAALEKWVEAKRLAARERQDWRVEKAVLADRVQLVERETAALREAAEQVSGSIGETEKKLADAAAEVDALKAATAGLHDGIGRLEERVLVLLERVPAPVAEKVKPLSQRIPKPGAVTRLGLSDRFQNVIGILNELNKTARDILVASEVRELPDGGKAEVTVVYLGLAWAFYVNEASGLAGLGQPGPLGWEWEARNDLVGPVADVIAIYRNEKPAGYVVLPGGVR